MHYAICCIHMLQLLRFAIASSNDGNFNDRYNLSTVEYLTQGFRYRKLCYRQFNELICKNVYI